MKSYKNIDDLISQGVKGKNILYRADLNVPIKAGRVSDVSRIEGIVPTLSLLSQKGAKVILISHFGRPTGVFDSSFSLAPIVDAVQSELDKFSKKKITVKFGIDCVGASAKSAIENLNDGEVIILENLRFHKEEEQNDVEFSKALAAHADFYVNDAFSCSHRAHASIEGVTHFLPSFAGSLLDKEIKCLTECFNQPKKPSAAVIGGSKVSTKMDILNSMVTSADYLFIGGGMANTFLFAQGYKVGKSLCETDLKKEALNIIKLAEKNNCKILLPIDAVVSDSIDNPTEISICDIDKIPADKMILDIGIKTFEAWSKVFESCKTLIWNGPAGAFEFSPFDNGSVALARKVAILTAENGLNSIAGGGDTVALLKHAGVKNSFSYISTAGGAFLEWLEGKGLPGVSALEKQSAKKKTA